MKFRSFLTSRVIACLIFIILIPAAESMAVVSRSKWSGRVELGLMGVSTTSRVCGIDPDDYEGVSGSFSTIDNLDKNLSYENFISSFLLFNVNYQMNDTTALYLGTPFFDDTRQGLTAGVQKLLANDSLVDLSVFLGGEVLWEDPYLIGVERKVTEALTFGMILDTDGLFGTALTVNYMVKGTRVGDDKSGESDSRLRREGYTHKLKTGYSFYIDERFESVITPALILTRDERKGEANASNGIGTELSYSTEGEKNALSMTGTVEAFRYDRAHPLFSKRREDWVYSIESYYTRKHLWDRNWYMRLGCGVVRIDSSIGFFDETDILCGISLGYSFE
jgi:hypothetical protein